MTGHHKFKQIVGLSIDLGRNPISVDAFMILEFFD